MAIKKRIKFKDEHIKQMKDPKHNQWGVAGEPKKKTCPCGRSPIALCIGWHSLSESEYQIKLKAWNEHHNKEEK